MKKVFLNRRNSFSTPRCRPNRTEPNVSGRTWLEESIIWEPVDGQHVVAAYKQAKLEYKIGLMDENEYKSVFAQRKAQFVVYDDPTVYIEASVQINAQEFERNFYKPNPEVCGKRKRAVTMAASALHWTRTNGKKVTLGWRISLNWQYAICQKFRPRTLNL